MDNCLWGFSVMPKDARYSIAWGARAILHRCEVDVLPDRQAWDGDKCLIKTASAMFNTYILPRAWKRLKELYSMSGAFSGVMELNGHYKSGIDDHGSSDERLPKVFRPYTSVRMLAQASGGYLYVVCFIPTIDPSNCVRLVARGAEFSELANKHKNDLKWSNDILPAIGSTIKVTMNNIGEGTVLAYREQAGWLHIMVHPHNPPEYLLARGDWDGLCWIVGAEIEVLAAA